MKPQVEPAAGPSAFFTEDHRACDEAWAKVEEATDAEDASAAQAAFRAFDSATRRHLEVEERLLFPAFEAATGMSSGPTTVMRMEHQRMRGVLDQMAAAGGNLGALADLGDTLLMLTQQHNVKEEGMLYRMCEDALEGQWPELAARISEAYRA